MLDTLNISCVKQFKTNNMRIITACREQVGPTLPSDLISPRTKKISPFRAQTANNTIFISLVNVYLCLFITTTVW